MIKEIENTCREKNFFESSFDSFVLDDVFLEKIDIEVKKKNFNEKITVSKEKPQFSQTEKRKKMFGKKGQYCRSPLVIEDSDDSDFFDYDWKKKKQSVKVHNDSDKEKQNQKLWNNGFNSCLSPILGKKAGRSMNLSSSTPERNNESNSKEIRLQENSVNNSNYSLLKTDFFDDWDVNGDQKEGAKKETVTLSQALELIKEAELERQPPEEPLNQSIDLLTGEVIGADLGAMFEESFNLPESVDKKHKDKECSSESVNVKNLKTDSKPPAAQKLNFEHEKTCERKKIDDDLKNFYFSSDDDFEFFTQDLIKQVKKVPNQEKTDSSAPIVKKNCTASSVRDSDLNNSSDCNMKFNKKKRKCFVVVESDTSEDSPSPKFIRQNKIRKVRKQSNTEGNLAREFIDLEAEVSDEVEVSSDESEPKGEYDESFLDEGAYLTQNSAANMTAKYLESVKTVDRVGTFKIPVLKPYSPVNIFSQIPEESNSDYEFDSFCVKDVEEEEQRTDLSDLEIAEKILEMDRRKKKKKRCENLKK